jgi:hypothetical protein
MKWRFIVLAVVLVLTACSEGPSASDLQAIYRTSIKLISCAKVSNSVFRCRFAFTNPQLPADRGEHVQCFTTDGSKWEIKLLC